MNSFFGCDTEALTDLSAGFGERAGQLSAVMDGAAGAAHAAAWFGPDAEDFRDRVDAAVEGTFRLIETIRKLGELLRQQSAQQTSCSQPDEGGGAWDDALRSMRTEWPGSVRETDIAPLMTKPAHRGWGPLIGGPFMAPGPLRPIPPPQPLPEGEEFALDPNLLAEAQKDRRLTLGAIPIAGSFQMAMGLHDGIARRLDSAEEFLEDSGLGFATPIIASARIPHTLSGIALGERSVPGQMLDGIDRQLANTTQTAGEVADAIGDGDAGGAVRAAERGFYRHADAGADILTATALPAVAHAASQLTGSAADLVEPISPDAAGFLREAEEGSREFTRDLEDGHDWLTDGERYYDLRRQYAPMPWDPRE